MPESDQHRLGLFWRKHLHWQWTQFHGQSHCRSTEGPHANVSGLHIQIYASVHAPDARHSVVAVFHQMNPEMYEQNEIEILANYEETETARFGLHSGNGLRPSRCGLRDGIV